MLNELRLTHFKCYEQEESVPFAQFNIVYGKNGRGKSSFIQPLLLVSQTLQLQQNIDYLSLQGNLVKLGTFADVISHSSHSYSQFEIGINAEDENMQLIFAEYKDKPTLAKLVDIRNGDSALMGEMGTYSGTSGEKTVSSIAQSALKSFKYIKNLRYVSANRQGPKNIEPRQDSWEEPIVTPSADNLFNVLASISDEQIHNIQEDLSFVLSGASLRVNPKSDVVELFMDSANGNSNGYKPLNVGFGYSFVLPILIQIQTAKNDSLVIMENPEAHLYPAAQSRLTKLLIEYAKKKNLQLIIETHSDHIINGLRIAVKQNYVNRNDVSILYCDREEMGGQPLITHISVDCNGTLSEEPKDFMDEWTKQALALL